MNGLYNGLTDDDEVSNAPFSMTNTDKNQSYKIPLLCCLAWVNLGDYCKVNRLEGPLI